MILQSDVNLVTKLRDYISVQNKIIIFSPFIKIAALSTSIEGFEKKIEAIVTTWRPIDIANKVTDISIYSLCKSYDIKLLINNKIHLKSILAEDFTNCIISSSNITNRGLAISIPYNYELGTIIENLPVEAKCYFDKIIEDSILVTDEYYKAVEQQTLLLPEVLYDIPESFIVPTNSKEFFLTSDLPYFDRPEELCEFNRNKEKYSEVEVRSIIHDLRLYNCDSVGDTQEIKKCLKIGFNNNSFIRKFLEFNNEGKYFGELSSWLHNTLDDVPSPRRYEVKEYLVRVLKYINFFLEDAYAIIVPKKHSQYLKRL